MKKYGVSYRRFIDFMKEKVLRKLWKGKGIEKEEKE